MADWVIERLNKSHDRGAFRCGVLSLDTFLANLASQYEKRRLGTTYVAVHPGERGVLGYYTLASSAVAFSNLPATLSKKLPRHPVPTVLLARLAVDDSMVGKGLGKALLRDALQRCLDLSRDLGVFAVEVDAIDAQAKTFYEKYGFIAFEDEPLHLFLSVATIAQAFP